MFTNGAKRKRPLDIQKQIRNIDTQKKTPELSNKRSNPQARLARTQSSWRKRCESTSTHSGGTSEGSSYRKKRHNANSRSPLHIDIDSDSSDTEAPSSSKAVTLNNANGEESARKICYEAAFAPKFEQAPVMVQAADIPNLDKSTRYEAVIASESGPLALILQYPSAMPPER